VRNYQEGTRVKLSFDKDNGLTAFRDPDANGFIPVSSSSELRLINTVAGALAGKYKQDNNIDLKGEEWTPIGASASAAFTGEYDGGGYEIRNLRISGSKSNVGFFSYINGAKLRNIRLSGEVKGGQYVGGLCAQVSGQGNSIINCRSAVSVTGSNARVAGICANVNAGTTLEITACENSGAVAGGTGQYIAGICGYVNGTNGNTTTTTITACRNTGKVTASSSYVAGICGANAATYATFTVKACYNTGEVNAGSGSYAGGIVAYFFAGSNSITACYNTGSITGYRTTSNYYVGFICGVNQATAAVAAITTSYWTKNGGNATQGVGNNNGASGPGETYQFSASAWPTATGAWGVGDGSAENTWWKELGGWNSGGATIVYPKLYWEE
jgi:hypothetical protein